MPVKVCRFPLDDAALPVAATDVDVIVGVALTESGAPLLVKMDGGVAPPGVALALMFATAYVIELSSSA